jgi:hypothetical protein
LKWMYWLEVNVCSLAAGRSYSASSTLIGYGPEAYLLVPRMIGAKCMTTWYLVCHIGTDIFGLRRALIQNPMNRVHQGATCC